MLKRVWMFADCGIKRIYARTLLSKHASTRDQISLSLKMCFRSDYLEG